VGKQVSRANALRHGLAIDVGTDPAFRENIDKLAKLLLFPNAEQKVGEHAREAAEAELDLARIRKIRAFLFNALYFVENPTPDCLAELNDKLDILERYERRAFSRRRRALRAMS
jgi:hypothetical protein